MFERILEDGVEMRPVEERWAEQFWPVIEANRDYLLPWMPWAMQVGDSCMDLAVYGMLAREWSRSAKPGPPR